METLIKTDNDLISGSIKNHPKGWFFYGNTDSAMESALAHWACRPLITCERGSAGSTGSEGRAGGAAHKNIETPRSINSGDAQRWHFSH